METLNAEGKKEEPFGEEPSKKLSPEEPERYQAEGRKTVF